MSKIEVRFLKPKDIQPIARIERTNHETIFTEADLRELLRRKRVLCRVATIDDLPVGFIIYEHHKDHIDVLCLATRKDSRRQGVGTALVDDVKSRLTKKRRHSLVFHLRESNLCGHLFLRSNKLRCENIEPRYFKDYYESNNAPIEENAYVFSYDLTKQVEEEVAALVG